MAIRKMIWALAAVAIILAAPAFAQVQKGTITVTVVDNDGAALPGATASAEAEDSLTRRSGTTDEKGIAELVALDPSTRYVVTVTLDGFSTGKTEGVAVRSGQTSSVRVKMAIGTVTESINVTGEAPVVDVTNAITGLDVTLELTESLPTGRSYQTYLQLVPGVKPSTTGNPASRSGINFTDVNGVVGQSSDNAYYIEGINVTDRTSGTFGANLNTEIIQEQAVLTGALPAQYAGAPGLVSNVATKSGGNNFSGSLNYFFQNDSLVADNENLPDAGFSTYDTAFTLGGPIVQDKAWFFASYRIENREEDITNRQGQFLRTIEVDQDQSFGKISWNISENDLLTGVYLDDPFERSGSIDFTVTNPRSRIRTQGGDRFLLNYTRVFNNLVIEAKGTSHEGEVSDLPALDSVRNNVIFRRADNSTAAQQQLGGSGVNIETLRSNDELALSLDWNIDTDSAGSHGIKIGAARYESEYFEDDTLPGGARFDSVTANYLGQNVTALQLRSGFTAQFFNPNNTSDRGGLINAINNSANRVALFNLLDTNRDGALSVAEIGAIVFNSTAGNPNGQINYNRTIELSAAPYDVRSEGDVAYLQDTWQVGKWAINAGIRAERTEAIGSDGSSLFTFDWEVAPRVSVAWDVFGNGRHRVSAYYGRYYDPIRDNMADFAGAFTGPVRHEQVFVGGEWLTYRVRGGTLVLDSVFSPTTKTPYTDEITLGYKVDLGQNMSFEVTGIKRETRDIFEDFDLCLYAGACYSDFGNPNAPGSLFLGLPYFGFTEATLPGNVNFFLATLAGGERNFEGVEFVFRKRMSNNWQMIASYTYADGEGNSNSDSNADFAGDDLQFDPRAPNMFGTLNGHIDHLLKLSGSYELDFGLEFGGTYNWNSGIYDTPAVVSFNRYLPVHGEEFDFNGTTYAWTEEGAIGSIENDSYGTLDLRASYAWKVSDAIDVDLFLDIFNVFDEQATIQVETAEAGNAGLQFLEGKVFVDPQRFYLGARLRF